MGYRSALVAAGAKVLLLKRFGTDQGDWYAKVSYQGRVGWVSASYGSCVVCDSYEMYAGLHEIAPGRGLTRKQEAEFGSRYLDNLLTQEQVEAEVEANVDWDLDAQYALEWLRANAI